MSIKGLVKQFKKARDGKVPEEHTPKVQHKGANIVVVFEKRVGGDTVLIPDKLRFDISVAMRELAQEFELCMKRSTNTCDSLTYTFETA